MMGFKIKGHILIIFVLTFWVIFSSIFVPNVSSSGLKIGYINSQRIIDESKAGKETTQKMESFKEENTEKLEQKNKEIEALEQELRKKEFAITPETKKEIEDKIREKNLELKFFKEAKEKELKEIFYKNLKSIENQVLAIVQKIGQEENYDLILGRDESGILYANPAHDLTDKIIQIYDQQIQQKD
jgi:outer membrane protein